LKAFLKDMKNIAWICRPFWKYGKIYMTDNGYLLAKDMLRCIELIRERLPAMGFDLTEEEMQDFVRTMVVNLPEHCRRRLAGRV